MPDREQIEKLFMHKVLKMMMSLDKVDKDVLERLTSWTFSGFVLIPNLRFVNQASSKAYRKNGHSGFRKSGVRIRFCVQSAEKKWTWMITTSPLENYSQSLNGLVLPHT